MREFKLQTKIIPSLLVISLFFLCSCNSTGVETLKQSESPQSISIGLYGEEHVTVNYGSKYIDEGAWALKVDTDISDDIQVISNLDINKLGEYTITYSIESAECVRHITVKDIHPPVIELLGSKDVFMAVGEEYSEDGFTATDNYDGDITDRVVITGEIDTATEGSYVITYCAIDSSENKTEVSRTINIVTSPLTQSLQDFSLDGLFGDTIIPETILTEEEIEKYLHETIIIGDSRAGAFRACGLIPESNSWDAPSITPLNIMTKKVVCNHNTSEKDTVLNLLAEHKPKRVIFIMGIDNAGGTAPDLIAQSYAEFLLAAMEASPDTQIIVHNVMPVSGELDQKGHPAWYPNNQKINHINYYLAKMCSELDIHFIDSHKVLKSVYGMGIDYCFSDDLVHLSYTGNKKIFEYIVTHPLID